MKYPIPLIHKSQTTKINWMQPPIDPWHLFHRLRIFIHVSMCRKYNISFTMCITCVVRLWIIGWIFPVFNHTATAMTVGIGDGISTKALLVHTYSGTDTHFVLLYFSLCVEPKEWTGGQPEGYHFSGTWWRHQMETFPRYWPFVRGIHRSPVNSPHKGQWRGALMFALICAWISIRTNNREAGDLRRYGVHNDVIVMK